MGDEIVEQRFHGDEDAVIIGGGGEGEVAPAEGGGEDFGCIGDGGVKDLRFDAFIT